MKTFFGDSVLLHSPAAEIIYGAVKDLPIIDYHCHLDQTKIRDNATFSDIGELWLSGDHYKWRAMRLAGVDEHYITGEASYHDKFVKYASVMPLLAGNALYYWAHMELSQIFDIHEPLNQETAEDIYRRANEKLKTISVVSLLSQYKVQYVATTDSPCDDLSAHGTYGDTVVAPTYRPDKLLAFDAAETERLETICGYAVDTLDKFLEALESRLAYFVSCGCKIADHGFLKFPCTPYVDKAQAEELYLRRHSLTGDGQEMLFGYLLVAMAKMYHKYGILMQLHFAVTRNINPTMLEQCGVDSGFDVMSGTPKNEDVIRFFARLSDKERPETVLYTLNDNALSSLACLTGAFRHVQMGPAWWMNDTVLGIRKNLEVIGEYSILGTNFGMLTDSRSFASYARFDFFRRLLSDHLGNLVEHGEYAMQDALTTAKNICYYNIKGALGL